MKKNWELIVGDSRSIGSASTTLFYLYLVNHLEPNTPTLVNTRKISHILGITNPYNHLRKLVDTGLIKRENKGVHGTILTLLKSYE